MLTTVLSAVYYYVVIRIQLRRTMFRLDMTKRDRVTELRNWYAAYEEYFVIYKCQAVSSLQHLAVAKSMYTVMCCLHKSCVVTLIVLIYVAAEAVILLMIYVIQPIEHWCCGFEFMSGLRHICRLLNDIVSNLDSIALNVV